MRVVFSLFLALATSTVVHAAPAKKAPAKAPARKAAPARSSAPAAKKAAPVNSEIAAPLKGEYTIRNVIVEGQRKLEKDAILDRIQSKKGAAYRESQVRDDVLSLFKLGYFNDIQVLRTVEGGAVDLTFRVLEKPSITEIAYDGISDLKSEDLNEASGLKAFEMLNMNKIREAVEKIQKLYEDKGYFLARIEPVVTDIEPGQKVKLTFKISEGEKVKVKKIVFVGNKRLTDALLKGNMFTQEEGFFTGLSGSGAYKQEAFERDVVMLRMAYYSRGYIQAKIDRPQVSLTPDKKGIYLTIRIEEGEQYNVGEVDFAGDLLFPRAELFQTIKIDKNGVFAYDVLQKDMSELQAKYGDLGYAYANIIPRWEFREAEKKINVIFDIDKGNKVYFGKINVTGNSKTRDKVVRRELKIMEGELYNETRRRTSLENIQRLGFFEEVNFKTSTPPDHLDMMDVEIVVKERNTGQIQLSAGYSSTTYMTFGGSVQQTNFLGKGQNLGVSLNLTKDFQEYNLSFTDPYYNDTQWSVGYRLFRSENSGREYYTEKRTGASVSLGHPISDNTNVYLSYGYTVIRLGEVSTTINNVSVPLTDPDLFPLQTASGDASTVEGSVVYDTRNDRFRPSKGWYLRTALGDTGLVGGNLHYYTASQDVRFFYNLFWDLVWRNSFQYGRIGSTDKDRDPPFNELFLLGGPYSLRGYQYGHVGRMKRSAKYYADLGAVPGLSPADREARSMQFYGGTQRLLYQTELQFPLIREAQMFGVVFYDVGQAEDDISASNFFSDWGFGIRWFSPIGPLRFEWGFPLNANPLYHSNQEFQFSIGTPF